MKYLITACASLALPALVTVAPSLGAHELISINGLPIQHSHVYRRNGYGEPLQQGHTVNPDGGPDITLWGPRSRNHYGAPAGNDGVPLPDNQVAPEQGPDINIQRRGSLQINSYGNPPDQPR